MTSTDGLNDTSAHTWAAVQWATALQTYRHSVDLYRHVLHIRAQRYGRTLPTAGAAPTAVARPDPIPPTATAGLVQLTPREREVAQLLAHGFTNQQIAERLVVTRGTVANHVAHILDKLGFQNRTQVAAYLIGRFNQQTA